MLHQRKNKIKMRRDYALWSKNGNKTFIPSIIIKMTLYRILIYRIVLKINIRDIVKKR